MKKTLAALIIGVSALSGGAAYAADEVKVAELTKKQTEAIRQAHDAKPAFNFFDPTTWTSGFSGHASHGQIAFDPMNPADWAKPFDPKTHTQWHATMMNPAYYAQYMTPGYYMKFMDPKTWYAYIDMKTYEPLIKASSDMNTYTYWMNPGNYMHAMDPSLYMAAMDPNAYIKLTGDVVKGYGDVATTDTANLLNPFAWMKTFADASTAMVPTTEQKKTQ